MSKIRNRFKDEEVKAALQRSKGKGIKPSFTKMASILSANTHGTKVSPELARYWAKQFDDKKKNGEDYMTLTKANRVLKDMRELKEPKPEDFLGYDVQVDSSVILVIPDQHAPYHHPDTIDFLIEVAAHYRPTMVVNLGDETDGHAMSFHDSDPNLMSAGPELVEARKFIHELERVFPVQFVCHSNHGSLLYRKAKAHGIPVEYLRTYREVLFPEGSASRGLGWSWNFKWEVLLPDGSICTFQHQASSNKLAIAAHTGGNLVVGHEHGKYQIEYAQGRQRYWAMVSGCLIDPQHKAFSYGDNFANKPILGCSVIVDSIPQLIPMRLDSEGRWIRRL
uniref:Calcineurin-like phosphoesterase n=1 Tax=Pseudomonas phage Ulina01 TaxID=3138549 RepID=A0AAU6W013_9CAUD